MSDCCSSNNASETAPKKINCPSCDQPCHEVPFETVLQHVKTPWRLKLTKQHYYFCGSRNCDTVYIALDKSSLNTAHVRTKIGSKVIDEDALICYCFDVTRVNALQDPSAKAFVVEQTKNGSCACTTRNPSGKCCLKDFPQ